VTVSRFARREALSSKRAVPTFSIITANFNSGEKLAATAASVLSQDADLEYLIMDGASTDRSIEIARQLAHDHSEKIRLISEPDHGVYDAMNKGIGLAIGRYILFLGAGDTLLPGILKRVDTMLPGHDSGFLYGDVNRNGHRYDGEFTWRKLLYCNICHQAIFYGRDVFKRCGQFNLKYPCAADHEFNLRCFGRRAIKKRYIPLIISNFEPGGISSLGDDVLSRDWEGLMLGHLGYWRFSLMIARRAAGRIRRRLLGYAKTLST
jgi:glycosyltransferase involved in cell wall biosynthesis